MQGFPLHQVPRVVRVLGTVPGPGVDHGWGMHNKKSLILAV